MVLAVCMVELLSVEAARRDFLHHVARRLQEIPQPGRGGCAARETAAAAHNGNGLACENLGLTGHGDAGSGEYLR